MVIAKTASLNASNRLLSRDIDGGSRGGLPPGARAVVPRSPLRRRPTNPPVTLFPGPRDLQSHGGHACGHYVAGLRLGWMVNPSFPRILTAPAFPPSKSPEPRRSPVANS